MSDTSKTIDVTPPPSADVVPTPNDDVTTPAADIDFPSEDRRDEISRLKHQKGGFLSHLSRLYKEADQLMLKRGTVSDVMLSVEKVRAQFLKLEHAHVTLTELLPADERDAVALTFTSYETNLDEFLQRTTEYIRESTLSRAPSESSAVSTTSSVRAKAASIARKREQLKLEQMLADRQLQELEEQLAAQQRELQHRRDVLRQRAELEQAKAAELTWTDVTGLAARDVTTETETAQERASRIDFSETEAAQERPSRITAPETETAPGRTSRIDTTETEPAWLRNSRTANETESAWLRNSRTANETESAWLRNSRTANETEVMRDFRYQHETGLATQAPRTTVNRAAPTQHIYSETGPATQAPRTTVNRAAPTQHISETGLAAQAPRTDVQSSNELTGLANFLQTYLTLPPPELISFSGETIDFNKFMQNFEVNIEQKVSDNRQRLNYLIKYTTGEPRELIESCVMLGDPGYYKAKDLLQDRYGKSHVVAQAHVSAHSWPSHQS